MVQQVSGDSETGGRVSSMKIRWTLSIGYLSAAKEGEIEVDDDASEDFIEGVVRGEVFQCIEWDWAEAE